MTAVINEKGKIVQWYYDITLSNGLTEDGIPYFDDLYLDVIVLPNMKVYILDEEELLQELITNEITEGDFKLATTELNRLHASLTDGNNDMLKRWETDYRDLSSLLEGDISFG